MKIDINAETDKNFLKKGQKINKNKSRKGEANQKVLRHDCLQMHENTNTHTQGDTQTQGEGQAKRERERGREREGE